MLQHSLAHKLRSSRSGPAGLYAAAFLFDGAHAMLLVALPFVITRLGGSDRELGLAFGLYFVSYIAACALTAPVTDRFNLKNITRLGAAGIATAAACIYLTFLLHQRGSLSDSAVILTIAFMMLAGLTQSLFWPPLMGWLSAGHEGPPLARRFGIFNFSWGAAMVLCPFVGGYLVELSPAWPLLAVIALYLTAFCSVSIAPAPPRSRPAPAARQDPPVLQPLLHPKLPAFRWMARLALLGSAAAVALMRTQLALFMTQNYGLSESCFGLAITLMSLAMVIIMFAAGGLPFWHHKAAPLFVAQLLLVLSMPIILKAAGFGAFATAALFVGLGHGFMYASHQFYGVSGGIKRSGLMAIHEMTLAAGYVFGSIFGGYLGKHFGRHSPYYFGLSLTAAALAAQVIIRLFAASHNNALTSDTKG